MPLGLPDVDRRVYGLGRGRWLDNVFIERLWRSLKYECALKPVLGFAPLRDALAGLGRKRFEMVISRGANPAYRVCSDTAPESVSECDQLEFALRAERPGDALCAALGEDGAFGLLAPALHYGAPDIRPDRWTRLPQDLPPASDLGPVVWPALGDPGATLVFCALFAAPGDVPLAPLAAYAGQVLSLTEVEAVSEILRDSRPLATAEAVVSIIPANSE